MARFVKLRIPLFHLNFLSIFSVKVECPATLQIENTLDNMMYAYANHLFIYQLHMQEENVLLIIENVYDNIYDDSDDDILPELLPANDDDDEIF